MTAAEKIRVVVAEDSLSMRKFIVEALGTQPDLEVVGEAADGREAVALCHRLKPDVLTMDMAMPVMTGLDAIEEIMAYAPTPILILSASTNRGDLFRTYDALAAGAVECFEKPDGVVPDADWAGELARTIRLVSKIRVITHPRAKLRRQAPRRFASPRTESAAPEAEPSAGRVVAIGASTGGPAAVADIFRRLPSSFPVPILLVIHIGASFSSALAEWLDASCGLRVGYPADGHLLASGGEGRVWMAPPDCHLTVKAGRIRLEEGPERHSCRPSVDVLFESVAREYGARAIGCLLTGMGRDGADGLLAIRRSGGTTLAQDEATSVVFGMPREASLAGAVERQLPLEAFATALLELASDPARRCRS